MDRKEMENYGALPNELDTHHHAASAHEPTSYVRSDAKCESRRRPRTWMGLAAVTTGGLALAAMRRQTAEQHSGTLGFSASSHTLPGGAAASSGRFYNKSLKVNVLNEYSSAYGSPGQDYPWVSTRGALIVEPYRTHTFTATGSAVDECDVTVSRRCWSLDWMDGSRCKFCTCLCADSPQLLAPIHH